MKETTPEIFLIARPSIDWHAVRRYLSAVGGGEWADRIEPSGISAGEALIEFAGRLCYRSWTIGLNPNVSKIRTDTAKYIANILESRHGSVLEHSQYTFVFHNVSRVFTHELVRHRAGVAISQESLRYVRLTDFGFRVPPALNEQRESVIAIVEHLQQWHRSAVESMGLDKKELPFSIKKEITSALRRLAPMGLSTSIVWTANVRTIRHVLEMRTAPGAEEEMRLIFDQVGAIMVAETPILFADFTRDSTGCWLTPNAKV